MRFVILSLHNKNTAEQIAAYIYNMYLKNRKMAADREETGKRNVIRKVNKEIKQEKGLVQTDHDNVPWTKGYD